MVDFLAKRGVDCKRGKNGITPFHMACYRGISMWSLSWRWNGVSMRGPLTGTVGRRWRWLNARSGTTSWRSSSGRIRNSRRLGRAGVAAKLATTFGGESAPCSELSCVVA